MEAKDRVICRYDSGHKGPLLICIGAMHGNEPAGVKAIEFVHKMLEVEPIKNQDFNYKGRFIGIVGNLQAFNKNKRFFDKDLNRQFRKDHINNLFARDASELINEDKELVELIQLVRQEINAYNPSQLIVLDLHTTSSFGGIFTICKKEKAIVNIATSLHAPIVFGIIEGLKGTTLHYFIDENMGIPTHAITFESGQHTEPLSINRAIAGIICLMREIGAVQESDVENYHEEILKKFSEDLPKLTQLVEHHPIEEEDNFQMKNGFKNFQYLEKDTHLAKDKNGSIFTKNSGYLLMPLYQKQGEDGYFIVQKIDTI